MVDRDARNRMIAALQAFMDARITAFTLDDALRKIDTADNTVKALRRALWCHYDDMRDHTLTASKAAWDYFNRLLLLLASDGEMATVKAQWHWSVRHYIAVTSLLLFSIVAYCAGVSSLLLVDFAFFGVVSMILAIVGRHAEQEQQQTAETMTPFPSFKSLIAIRRAVPAFARRQYPVIKRQLRKGLLNQDLPAWLLWMLSTPFWVLFCPIILLAQSVPERADETRIVLSV